MSEVGIVLVSHSAKVVEGVKEIIRQVITDVPIETAGGTDDEAIGTSVEKISAAIERAGQSHGVLLFYDLGSAKMNAELACEVTGKQNVIIAEAPLLEGAYVAAVEASIGKNIAEIVHNLSINFSNKSEWND